MPASSVYVKSSAGIYEACFRLESAHFRENKPKTLVFVPIHVQRHMYMLVLAEIKIEGGI